MSLRTRDLSLPNRPAGRRRRAAFTLFEVILAIGLSTLLLALIGTAINLYLTRIETRRSDIEWVQLARAVFAMIGDDLRAASEYKPQDTTTALAGAAGASFDPNAVFSGGTGATGTGATGTGATATATVSSATTTSTAGVVGDSLLTTPGIHGTLEDLIIDASRPLRADQLFATYAGYTNIAAAVGPAAGMGTTQIRAGQSDLKTVRYFIRVGETIDPNSLAATSLQPTGQILPAGMVRQEIDRAQRISAEQLGDQALLESGQTLVAPEVVRMEFRYFDGVQVLEAWNMQEMGGLPVAVEVRLWIADPSVVNSLEAATMGAQGIMANAREYRQTIFLPTARPPSATGTTTTGTTTSAATGTGATGTGS